jgi:hypothetical protein
VEHRSADATGEVRFLEGLRADVVALQEVSPNHVLALRGQLSETGLHHVIARDGVHRHFPFLQVVASRWPLDLREAGLPLNRPQRARRLSLHESRDAWLLPRDAPDDALVRRSCRRHRRGWARVS